MTMSRRLDQPKIREVFAVSTPRRLRLWTGLCLVLWVLMGGGDWWARIVEFRWQNQWLAPRKPSSAAQRVEMRQTQVPARTGAGLTAMVPSKRLAKRYEEPHSAYTSYRDGDGYSNPANATDHAYPIVILGDSFMQSLGTQHFGQVLAEVGDIPVYNHARAASGPFLEMIKFLRDDRFDPRPSVVVWNLSARELGADLFVRQPVETWFQEYNKQEWAKDRDVAQRIQWSKLTPAILRKDFPNTSIMAYWGRHAWGYIRLVAFHAWPWDVIGHDDPQFGAMLFYRENLRVLPLLEPGENAELIVRVIERIATKFRERGTTLVVLLVPEKEQVHIRALPETDQQALAHGDQLLAEIAAGVWSTGTPVVNLMPVFREVTAGGQRLYWRDDTHWNDAGIRLAAEEIWRMVEPILP